MPDSHNQIYDSVPMTLIRELLHEKGYDGFAYLNQGEDIDSISFAVFYPEQIITVSENGVIKEGIFENKSSENILTDSVPAFETQQYASVPVPTAVDQQILPAAPAQQETSATTEGAHEVTPFTARNFTNAEARKGYIDGFAEKLAETLGISKKDLLNRYGDAINELADDMEISSEIPEKNIEKLVSPLTESANFARMKNK